MGAQVICRRIMFLKIRLFRICFVHVSYIMYLHLIVLFFRLSEAGLLTIGRLAESGLVQLDRSLLTALVDRWRPETNTFHLPCGEMTPTLQDVAMLLGLPISGDAVGPRVVPPTWLDDLEERFANIYYLRLEPRKLRNIYCLRLGSKIRQGFAVTTPSLTPPLSLPLFGCANERGGGR